MKRVPERTLTPTPEMLLSLSESERTRAADPVYYLYQEDRFLRAETTVEAVDYNVPNLAVYECTKATRESHRVW